MKIEALFLKKIFSSIILIVVLTGIFSAFSTCAVAESSNVGEIIKDADHSSTWLGLPEVDPRDRVMDSVHIVSYAFLAVSAILFFFGLRRLSAAGRKKILVAFLAINILGALIWVMPALLKVRELRQNEKKCAECILNDECKVYTKSDIGEKASTFNKETRKWDIKKFKYSQLTQSEKENAWWFSDENKYKTPFYQFYPCPIDPKCVINFIPSYSYFSDVYEIISIKMYFINFLLFLLFSIYLTHSYKKKILWPLLISVLFLLSASAIYVVRDAYEVYISCG